MTGKIRILLADDHTLVREGLKHMFALTTTITVAAEASSGAQVLEALHGERFDLILLDMVMPGIAGAELIAHILAHDGHPPILVLSMHNEPKIVRGALAAGAAGYLTKDSAPAILLAAIHTVANGGRFIDPVLAEMLAFESSSQLAQGHAHEILTKREYQIFQLVAKGVSVNAIAADLAISNKTVSTHKARLMEKMGFASNADIVRYATLHGLSR